MSEPRRKTKTVYINYFDKIDDIRVKHLMALITQIIGQEKPDRIYFIFASGGGNVDAGVAFYNFLKSLPQKIIMHNIGSIDSIATVIFLAGKVRYAAPHATFLYHGVSISFNSLQHLGLPQINEVRDRILKDHKKIAGIISDNTKISEKEIMNLFYQGETKDTGFALEKGVIHKIKLLQIPQDALIISVNING